MVLRAIKKRRYIPCLSPFSRAFLTHGSPSTLHMYGPFFRDLPWYVEADMGS